MFILPFTVFQNSSRNVNAGAQLHFNGWLETKNIAISTHQLRLWFTYRWLNKEKKLQNNRLLFLAVQLSHHSKWDKEDDKTINKKSRTRRGPRKQQPNNASNNFFKHIANKTSYMCASFMSEFIEKIGPKCSFFVTVKPSPIIDNWTQKSTR